MTLSPCAHGTSEKSRSSRNNSARGANAVIIFDYNHRCAKVEAHFVCAFVCKMYSDTKAQTNLHLEEYQQNFDIEIVGKLGGARSLGRLCFEYCGRVVEHNYSE
jgi:hypothetical protein